MKIVIFVLAGIPSAHHFISVAKKMKMVIFVKLRQAVAKASVSVTQINVVLVFLFLSVSDVLITRLERAIVRTVQEASMMFLA